MFAHMLDRFEMFILCLSLFCKTFILKLNNKYSFSAKASMWVINVLAVYIAWVKINKIEGFDKQNEIPLRGNYIEYYRIKRKLRFHFVPSWPKILNELNTECHLLYRHFKILYVDLHCLFTISVPIFQTYVNIWLFGCLVFNHVSNHQDQ